MFSINAKKACRFTIILWQALQIYSNTVRRLAGLQYYCYMEGLLIHILIVNEAGGFTVLV